MKGSRLGSALYKRSNVSNPNFLNTDRETNRDNPGNFSGESGDPAFTGIGKDFSLSSNSSGLSKPKPSSHQSRPRSEHPLNLIRFPSPLGSKEYDNDPGRIRAGNETEKAKLSEWISTNKLSSSIGENDEHGESSQKIAQNRMTPTTVNWDPLTKRTNNGPLPREGKNEEFSFFKVPKPSQSAKKLANPYLATMLPKSANPYASGRKEFSSYNKIRRSFLLSAGTGQNQQNSASGAFTPSNNIGNKILNKPKRSKTGIGTGLRKGLNTINNADANTSSSSGRRLLFFSDAKRMGSGSGGKEVSEHGQSCLNNSGDLKVLSGPVSNLTKSMSSLSTKLGERVQVIRTAEERDENPDSIRMDGMGLKAFPYIGGGEGPSLKLLSLQRNLISRLESTPSHLSHLVVLDLYYNKIERITGLQGFTSLRVLLLGKNRIRRIEGLENLKRLEILDLHGNLLRYVDNLAALTSLRVLNLAGNMLRQIRNLGPSGLPSLAELNLKRNRIRTLDGLVKVPNLKKLLLANNDLQSYASLLPLRKLVFLQELLLEPNPLSSSSDGRLQVLTMLPWLIILDRVEITETMRSEARQWQKRRLEDEEERKKIDAKVRAGSPSGGPPNSREQAIYQARRRWESVKNFVKNSNSKPTNPSSPSPSGANARLWESGTNEIGQAGLVRSEIDDDLNSHFFRSKSRSETLEEGKSSKESKSKDVLCEFQCGVGELNLAKDLDPYHPEHILVSDGNGNVGQPVPEDSCPPSMINDLGSQDYVNTNSDGLVFPIHAPLEEPEPGLSHASPSKTSKESSNSQVEDQKIGLATQGDVHQTLLLLSSQEQPDPQMDSAIITNIIKEGESTQSPQLECHLTRTSGPGIDGEEGLQKIAKKQESFRLGKDANVKDETIPEPFIPEDKSMRIAVVKPILREATFPITHGDESSIIMFEEGQSAFNLNMSRNRNNDVIAEPIDFANLSQENIDGHKLPQNNNQEEPKEPIGSHELESNSKLNQKSELSRFMKARSPSDSDGDKIIQSNKSEIMTGSEKILRSSVTPGNMLLRSASTCLSDIISYDYDTEEKDDSRPTFTLETLDQRNINKQEKEETRIINNAANVAATFSLTGAVSSSPSPLNSQNGNETTSQNFPNKTNRMDLRKLRSASFDERLPSSIRGGLSDDDVDVDDDDTCSFTTTTTPTGSTTTIATSESPRMKQILGRKQFFPRTKAQKQKLLRDRPFRAQSSTLANSRVKSGSVSNISSVQGSGSGGNATGVGRGDGQRNAGKGLRRCDSAVTLGTSLSETGSNLSSAPLKRQGTDFLVEIDGKGKVLSIYGQGALKHTLTGFTSSATNSVTTAKFHYISYDTLIPFFGKMRQIYPALEHFQFRANNIARLSQLNALSDLQGLTSLHIAKEGNPLVSQDSFWSHYASYRLSHWGLHIVNGKEVSSEYRGGLTGPAKCFESLGFLALSCLPQTALSPLAKRLHMLHCFCCCSPSSSSDESGKAKPGKSYGNTRTSSPLPQEQQASSSNICTSWDDDPVLLDVIGKEALVHCPTSNHCRPLSPSSATNVNASKGDHNSNPTSSSSLEVKRRPTSTTLNDIVVSGVSVLEKLDKLEKTWPNVMVELVEEILMDYNFMDVYMKKELKKCQDAATIALHNERSGRNK